MRDLRISVTDRCNFRCGYCMPADVFDDGYSFLPRAQLLSYEEIVRLARICVTDLGVRKLRITGGEPLLRRELPTLVAQLAAIDGVQDLSLTTNGLLLGDQAAELRAAGLQRVTVSLDSLDSDVFASGSGVGASLERVLAGIEAAAAAGLLPLKINCVIRRNVNEDAVEALVEHFRGSGHIVRFIEYMDVGTLNGWRRDQVVSADEILTRIGKLAALEPIEPTQQGEVARRYRYTDGSGEVGVIASVSDPFCGDCSRARLSADGRLLSCLFAESGLDLKTPLRTGATDRALRQLIVARWRGRADRYSQDRVAQRAEPGTRRRLEMYQVGG